MYFVFDSFLFFHLLWLGLVYYFYYYFFWEYLGYLMIMLWLGSVNYIFWILRKLRNSPN